MSEKDKTSSPRSSVWDMPSRIPGASKSRVYEASPKLSTDAVKDTADIGEDSLPEASLPASSKVSSPLEEDGEQGNYLPAEINSVADNSTPAPDTAPTEPDSEKPKLPKELAAPGAPVGEFSSVATTVPGMMIDDPLIVVPPAPWMDQPATKASSKSSAVSSPADSTQNPEETAEKGTDSAADGSVSPISSPVNTSDSEMSAPVSAPENELETTMVRRTSLLSPLPEATTATVPEDPAPKWQPRAAEEPAPDTGAILLGATVVPTPVKRGIHHVFSLLTAIFMLPIAWYLILDGATRHYVAAGTPPWPAGLVNYAALGEFVLGSLALILVFVVSRWSALGTFVSGAFFVAVGVLPLLIPKTSAGALERMQAPLENMGVFGANLYHHLEVSAGTGLFFVLGIMLLLVGFALHGARRKGIYAERIAAAAAKHEAYKA